MAARRRPWLLRPRASRHVLPVSRHPLSTCAAQDEKPLRLDVKLVSLFVNVTDKNGAIVGGLTQEDFKVTEDGRPQRSQSSSASRRCRSP